MAEAVILGYKLGRILTINNLVVEHKEEANFKDCVGRKADVESKNKPVQNENEAIYIYIYIARPKILYIYVCYF